jgi:UDP-2,4-diacetamido-2,4,6-trideoxy-beta-L-altropyranose hydrolase
MPGDTLIVRADATVAMGTGHVMRCLALAQAWQDDGGRCIFAMAESTPSMQERVHSEGFDLASVAASPGTKEDASELVKLAVASCATWVVVDGYQFGDEYQRTLKAAGLKLLFVDDSGHAGSYVADLVLDQNAHARESFYQRREPYTRLLLGTRYAMLRREFRSWRDGKRQIEHTGRKVLVTMGGSDPGNVTLRMIQALRLVNTKGLEGTIVPGGSNPHVKTLAEPLAGLDSIRLQKNVTNMGEIMAWADVAISAAGTVCWEMCLLGLPAILIDLAENQRPIARALDEKGIAIHLGRAEDVLPEDIAAKLEWLLRSPDVRGTMSQRGRSLVDGRGAERVVSGMRTFGWRLRRAQPEDCGLLYEWANDPDVRKASFSSDSITREGHSNWLDSKLADPNAILYLAIDVNHAPVGYARYKIEGTRALISIGLIAGFRGRGYGSTLLGMAVEELFRSTTARSIDAYVKPTNEASLRMFARAGFRSQDGVIFAGQPAVHFTLEKKSRD